MNSFGNESAIWENMDGLRGYNAKWNKSDREEKTKKCLLIYILQIESKNSHIATI